ncbi:hypothetical protein XENORESO_021244 [Xenotaenia resolanae]|uniref:PH domain-containing protein n=1 Tax=Xenotaenia resolanae TaxID=208358 RepID=A0ABV0W452_9TELE
MLCKVWSDFERRVRVKLRSLRLWWQAAFPLSVSPSMAADDYNPVSILFFMTFTEAILLLLYFLMTEFSIRINKAFTTGCMPLLCTGNGTMSRRRISVKELGQPDHQGWLYRKKETKGFLGIKWKKYWFVLKKTALYWYTNQLGTLPPPYSSTAPVETSDLLSSRVSTMTSQSSASSLAKQRQSWLDLVSQASSTLAGEMSTVQVHEQRLPQGSTEGGGASESVVPQDSSDSKGSNKERPAVHGKLQRHVLGPQSEGNCENTSDEMEKLYIHLKEASLSPIGDRKPSTKREFRASFVKRCKNQTVNDKLHHIRALNSTLKSKEADLQAIEQVLLDPEITSGKFREWKEANAPLMVEICVKDHRKGAQEAVTAAASVTAAPLYTLTEYKPPISKAKMTQITKSGIKAIKVSILKDEAGNE